VWGYNEKLFNRAGWEHILKKHGGKLPVSIKAVPEGARGRVSGRPASRPPTASC